MKEAIHLQWESTHYYLFPDFRNYNATRPDQVYHDGGALKEGNKGWVYSETPLDLSGFYQKQTTRQLVKWIKRDTDLPVWTTVYDLPDTLPADTNMSEFYNALNFPMGEDDEPAFAVYYAEYQKEVQHIPLTVDRWHEAVGQPPPVVNFSWRSEFPAIAKEYEQLLYLFPCSIKWDDKTKDWMKRLTVEAAGAHVDTYFHDNIVMYFKPSDVRLTLTRSYPIFRADNLPELAQKVEDWKTEFLSTVNEYRVASVTPCPRCNGSGIAEPIHGDTVKLSKTRALNLAIGLRTQRNSKTVESLVASITELARLASINSN